MRLIDADKLVKKSYWAYPSIDHYCLSKRVVDVGDIDVAPTVDAEPVRHGHWIDVADKVYAKFGEHTYVCSVCKKRAESFVGGSENWWCAHKPIFCPNCGAKMDEVKNENV